MNIKYGKKTKIMFLGITTLRMYNREILPLLYTFGF